MAKIPYPDDCGKTGVIAFAAALPKDRQDPLIDQLQNLRHELHLNDWLFYQLIRRTAQELCPKSENYFRYTVYKWWMLVRSGFDARLRYGQDKLLFYVQTDDAIFDIPAFRWQDRNFVCLNYHDYGNQVDLNKEPFELLPLRLPADGSRPFSYRINQLPSLGAASYQDRKLQFNYNKQPYEFTVKVAPQLQTLFANYPVVDYETCFNIPLSPETYASLIPLLRRSVRGLREKDGIEYLMHFTRYAFLFEQDSRLYGKEKRLSPEQTLLFDKSDCEDRAALFFYLVKELYDLPMIVVAYPDHVTIAVKFDKPVGSGILYKGERYTVCEPTPQGVELPLGESLPLRNRQPFEIVYAYRPSPY